MTGGVLVADGVEGHHLRADQAPVDAPGDVALAAVGEGPADVGPHERHADDRDGHEDQDLHRDRRGRHDGHEGGGEGGERSEQRIEGEVVELHRQEHDPDDQPDDGHGHLRRHSTARRGAGPARPAGTRPPPARVRSAADPDVEEPTMPVPGAVTDPQAVTTSRVQLDSGGDKIDAYLARPASSAGRQGGVIVIHEAFGPVEHIDDLARRFANAGFDAIAPNLYCRGGAPDPNDMGSVMTKMFGVPDSQAVADLEAAAAYLRGLDGVQRQGRLHRLLLGWAPDAALRLLQRRGRRGRAVLGRLHRQGHAGRRDHRHPPRQGHRPGRQRQLPAYVVGGAEDQNPSPEVLAELGRRLDATDKDATVEIFEGAGHAFLADYRPSYAEPQAHDLWGKVIAFFRQHLA